MRDEVVDLVFYSIDLAKRTYGTGRGGVAKGDEVVGGDVQKYSGSQAQA